MLMNSSHTSVFQIRSMPYNYTRLDNTHVHIVAVDQTSCHLPHIFSLSVQWGHIPWSMSRWQHHWRRLKSSWLDQNQENPKFHSLQLHTRREKGWWSKMWILEWVIRWRSFLLRSQVGSLSDHPLLVQTLVETPFSWYPVKQVYVAVEPSVVPSDRSTLPFSGSSNVPQSKITPKMVELFNTESQYSVTQKEIFHS